MLLLAVATSCAHGADGDARKAAHEPFSDRAADALLCDLSARSASHKVTEALTAAGLTGTVEGPVDGIVPTYFLHRDPNANLSRYDLGRARFFRANFPGGIERRAFRAELLPIRGRDCFSVKFWEDCSPETAPEGSPHEWHWCGDPVSSTFINRVQTLRPLLGGSAGAIEPD